jgi:hypothetical protein
MGALIGLAIQLAILAIGLMVTLMIWTVRVIVMLSAAVITTISSARKR